MIGAEKSGSSSWCVGMIGGTTRTGPFGPLLVPPPLPGSAVPPPVDPVQGFVGVGFVGVGFVVGGVTGRSLTVSVAVA